MGLERIRAVRGEAGYALTELLVSTLLFLLVMGAILSLGETTSQIAPRDQERALAIREAQNGLDRMVRELRQATAIKSTSPSAMHVEVGTDPLLRKQVLYQCSVAHPDDPANPHDNSYRRCVRVEALWWATLPALSTGRVVVDRVLNGTSVFSYQSGGTANGLRPTYVKAKIEVASRGERKKGYDKKFVLDDGFYLRNTDVGT